MADHNHFTTDFLGLTQALNFDLIFLTLNLWFGSTAAVLGCKNCIPLDRRGATGSHPLIPKWRWCGEGSLWKSSGFVEDRFPVLSATPAESTTPTLRPYLGVEVMDTGSEVVVKNILPGGGADDAGVQTALFLGHLSFSHSKIGVWCGNPPKNNKTPKRPLPKSDPLWAKHQEWHTWISDRLDDAVCWRPSTYS